MPQDRLALAVLRAALSPDLNSSSLVFSSPRTSAVIHGFRFARVVMVLVTVTSSIQFFCKQSQFHKISLRARGPPGISGALRSLRILRIERIGSDHTNQGPSPSIAQFDQEASSRKSPGCFKLLPLRVTETT